MTDQEFIEICENSNSMSTAAAKVGIHFNTFKRKAVKLGCYKTNQSGKGLNKTKMEGNGKIPLDEILEGKHPQYQTFKLKQRLLNVGLKSNQCEDCGITEWNSKPIAIELDHINGNSKDHRMENLRMLCPNCHSQTETFRAKNIKAPLVE